MHNKQVCKKCGSDDIRKECFDSPHMENECLEMCHTCGAEEGFGLEKEDVAQHTINIDPGHIVRHVSFKSLYGLVVGKKWNQKGEYALYLVRWNTGALNYVHVYELDMKVYGKEESIATMYNRGICPK